MNKLLSMPVWLVALLTGAKSFKANPIIGNPMLNKWGLHVFRMLLAHGIMRVRMLLLSPAVSRDDRISYLKKGFVIRENFLPQALFDKLEQEVRSYQGEVRECIQGDTLTHRIALDPDTLNHLPVTNRLMTLKELRRLLRFTGGHLRMPFCHIEVVRNSVQEGAAPDPQKSLHTDTFHPTMKFWLFLDDVDEQNGPFTYVPESNQLTLKRLKWEYQMSQRASTHPDILAARGSFRFSAEDRKVLGLPEPKAMKVRKNTLVIANTFGIHARGQAAAESTRLSIWGMSRTNPFLPFPGIGFEIANKLQYDALQWVREREDAKAEKRGGQSAWHKIK